MEEKKTEQKRGEEIKEEKRSWKNDGENQGRGWEVRIRSSFLRSHTLCHRMLCNSNLGENLGWLCVCGLSDLGRFLSSVFLSILKI